jgi:hypothetical protein
VSIQLRSCYRVVAAAVAGTGIACVPFFQRRASLCSPVDRMAAARACDPRSRSRVNSYRADRERVAVPASACRRNVLNAIAIVMDPRVVLRFSETASLSGKRDGQRFCVWLRAISRPVMLLLGAFFVAGKVLSHVTVTSHLHVAVRGRYRQAFRVCLTYNPRDFRLAD